MTPETAWLIERSQPEKQVPTVWLSELRWGPMTGYGWTTDAFEATRFESKEAAEAYMAEHSNVIPRQAFVGHAVEHGFITTDSRTEEALARAESDVEYALEEAGGGPLTERDRDVIAVAVRSALTGGAGYRIEAAGPTAQEIATARAGVLTLRRELRITGELPYWRNQMTYIAALLSVDPEDSDRLMDEYRAAVAARTAEKAEAADWRNAAIEAGGTGEIRPGKP